MAGKYSTWSKLPWNQNLPQGCPRLWERQHPKLGRIRDFDSTVRRVYELYEQNTLGPTDLIWLVHTLWGPNCHEIIICHGDVLDCGNEGTPNLAIYASFNSTAGVYVLYVRNSPYTHRPNMAGTDSIGTMLQWSHNLPQGRPCLWEWQHPKIGHVCAFDSKLRPVYELYVPNSPWTHGPNMAGTYSLRSKMP